MSDLISRQDAIDVLKQNRALFCDNTPESFKHLPYGEKCRVDEIDCAISVLINLPSAQLEHHFCRDCKWVTYHGFVDKYGAVESLWYCKNWGDSTDEEGFCHEWERKQDG